MIDPFILAIETSCDETAVAVLQGFHHVCASEIASQIDVHAAYGGVVPEVASRSHLQAGYPLIQKAIAKSGIALHQIDAFAATLGPGLATALLVGAALGKGLAIGTDRPFIGVNHLEGHLLSPFFGKLEIPSHLGLIVSGGHTLLVHVKNYGTYEVVGRTLDDAAGEAFDKVAKLMGLRYPGGPEVERLAKEGDPFRYKLPRAMMGSNDFQFSFSGLKTAVRYLLEREDQVSIPDLCASFQEAILDVLVAKTVAAARYYGQTRIGLSGGVGCNHSLQQRLSQVGKEFDIEVFITDRILATDNALMIAYAAAHALANRKQTSFDADIFPNFTRFG